MESRLIGSVLLLTKNKLSILCYAMLTGQIVGSEKWTLSVLLSWAFEQLPGLPHMGDVLRVFEQVHVVEGIGAQGDQVGIIAGLDPAALGRHAQIAEHGWRVGGRGFDGL